VTFGDDFGLLLENCVKISSTERNAIQLSLMQARPNSYDQDQDQNNKTKTTGSKQRQLVDLTFK